MVTTVIFIGWCPLARDLVKYCVCADIRRFHFVGVVLPRRDIQGFQIEKEVGIPLLGPIESLATFVRQCGKPEHTLLVVALGEERDDVSLRAIADCMSRGCEVAEIADTYETLTERVPVLHIHEHWLLSVFNGPRMWYHFLKRAIDISFSLALLVFLSPFILLVACAVMLTSGRPIFYQQCRVGRGGKEFVIYKFRTMVEDAEKDEAVWAVKNDPRTTRVGRFLRRFRIDETPQLFNVLKGDMSLIGPRPERPEFVQKLQQEIPFYSYRHVVKPGITGWAQVKYPYACSVEDSLQKLQYDLFGVRNASVTRDVRILIRTMWVVLSGAGVH